MSFSASVHGIKTDVVKRNSGEIQVTLHLWNMEHYLPVPFAKALHNLLGLAIAKAELEIQQVGMTQQYKHS